MTRIPDREEYIQRNWPRWEDREGAPSRDRISCEWLAARDWDDRYGKAHKAKEAAQIKAERAAGWSRTWPRRAGWYWVMWKGKVPEPARVIVRGQRTSWLIEGLYYGDADVASGPTVLWGARIKPPSASGVRAVKKARGEK